MTVEDELKMCLFEKDIFSLQAAKMEQRKNILIAQRTISESRSRIEEYENQIQQKQAELAKLGG
jgi:hypothetical protein